jgi:tRNA nucleotidyltransferase (CCA-adding enzyme)
LINQISEKFRVAIVGGAVRDFLMGETPKDIDYVVQASVEEFEQAFPGLEKVGNSFPVYLNPIDKSEIALTRTEVCVGSSYQDFECVAGVTIEEDLARRDFTCNSIAIHFKTQEYIDPFNGRNDIHNKILRSVNPAAFIDDPLRILRGFRFAARFGFTVHPDTVKLMLDNIHRLKDITMERIELELHKTYDQSEAPSVFFNYMKSLEGLAIHFQELDKATTMLAGKPEFHPEGSVFNHLMESFDSAKKNGYSYDVAIAALVHDLGKIESPNPPSHIMHECHIEVLDAFFERHRFSTHIMELSKVVFKHHMKIHYLSAMKDIKKIRFVRRIPRYLREEYIQACNCDNKLTKEQLDIFTKICYSIDTATKGKKAEIEAFVKTHKTKEAIDNFINNIILNKYKEIK